MLGAKHASLQYTVLLEDGIITYCGHVDFANKLLVYVPDTPKFATVHKLGSSLPTL